MRASWLRGKMQNHLRLKLFYRTQQQRVVADITQYGWHAAGKTKFVV